MREVRDAELVYDHCACGALWFDRAGLEEYGRRYEARALAPEAEHAKFGGPMGKACPRCVDAPLRELVVDGMHVGSCTRCRGHFVEHPSRWADGEKESQTGFERGCLEILSSLLGGVWWA